MVDRSKTKARVVLNRRLNAISEEEYDKFNHAAYEQTKQQILLLQKDRSIQTVLLYHAIKKWLEVDVSPLEAYFPDLQFTYAPQDSSAPFSVMTFDVILVPLYGYSDTKYRLGHGGGWYDKFLALQPQAIKIGVGLEAGKTSFTSQPHDIAMDCIVTELRQF